MGSQNRRGDNPSGQLCLGAVSKNHAPALPQNLLPYPDPLTRPQHPRDTRCLQPPKPHIQQLRGPGKDGFSGSEEKGRSEKAIAFGGCPMEEEEWRAMLQSCGHCKTCRVLGDGSEGEAPRRR